MTLLLEIIRFADEFDMLPDSGLVLACVSGGIDSVCLLEVLVGISYQRGFTVGAVHYNHGLRGEESIRDGEFVREYCLARGVPFYLGSGDVYDYAKRNKIGIEEAARNMRYGFFYDVAVKTGAVRIATAHTADDNAETIVINLARGTGTKGLSGIPPIRDIVQYTKGRYESELSYRNVPDLDLAIKHKIKVIRPMLRVSRNDVLLFANERGIRFVEDSTNCLDIFTRNKIRHQIVPVIKEINPRFIEAVATAAELSRVDDEYLSELAERFIEERWVNAECRMQNAELLEEGDKRFEFIGENVKGARGWYAGFSAEVEDLLDLPLAVSGRVIRKLCGGGLSYRHVKAVLELCGSENPSASLSLPGMTVFREYSRVVFGGDLNRIRGEFELICPVDGEFVMIPGLRLKMSCKSVVFDDTINKSLTSFLFKRVDLCGRMTVRSRREGDKIKLFGRDCTKTLKKLFIEYRIPVRERAFIPVIADDKGILAVYGIGMGDRAVPKSGDLAFQIIFEEI